MNYYLSLLDDLVSTHNRVNHVAVHSRNPKLFDVKKTFAVKIQVYHGGGLAETDIIKVMNNAS